MHTVAKWKGSFIERCMSLLSSMSSVKSLMEICPDKSPSKQKIWEDSGEGTRGLKHTPLGIQQLRISKPRVNECAFPCTFISALLPEEYLTECDLQMLTSILIQRMAS